MRPLIIAMALLALSACAPQAPAASASAPLTKSSAILKWLTPAPPYEEPQEITLGEHDPEYWAVLHLINNRNLIPDQLTPTMSREELDCAEAKMRALAKWSRTLPDKRIQSAWALWINVGLREIATRRLPPDEQANADPDKVAREAADTAGRVMQVKLAQPPDIECAKP